eukprot:jgi/Psemu1/52549/gm1.52549_g
MNAATNSAMRHFYKPEPRQSMPSPKPIQTPVFRVVQLHGTYFKCEDENERVPRVSQLDVFQHLDSSLQTNDNNNDDDDARGGQDPLAFKLATKATKKPFPSLSKGMVMRSNKLNKVHICLKWHLATKTRSAQELVKRIDPGYGWKIEVMRDPTTNPPPSPPTPEKIGEADLLNTLDWLVAPLHPKYKDDNHFKQDWFMGIYMQLMTNHCPEWVDNKPTCARNFASMKFPIFARDIEDTEASVAGPDIQLAQSWESPSTINSKATWDSESHEHTRFAKSHPPKGLKKILFQQSDAKTTTHESSTWADGKTQESSDNTSLSWNSPPFDVDAPSSPATATTDQLRSVEGAVVTAEKGKKKRNTTKPHSLGHQANEDVVDVPCGMEAKDNRHSAVVDSIGSVIELIESGYGSVDSVTGSIAIKRERGYEYGSFRDQ